MSRFLLLLCLFPFLLSAEFFTSSASKLRGQNIANPLVCTNGQTLTWVAANSRFECATPPGASGGEANTAANVGTAGVGLYDTKAGVQLQFRNVSAGSSKITVTLDAGNREVDLDVSEAALSLGSIGGSLSASQIAAASKQGNGSKILMFGAGTPATDDCAKFDASGNIVSSGAACGSGGGGSISSVFGRTGIVTAQSGDYSGTQITNTPSGSIIASTVQAAIDELASEKAALSHVHSGADITSGVIGPAFLGTGTRDGSKFLRDDGTWQASGGHAQNTDTGTSATSFQLDTANSGPRVKNSSGTLEVRNSADDAYSGVKASTFEATGSGAGGWLLTTGTAPSSPAAGKLHFYASSATGKLACIDSSGADCFAPARLIGYIAGADNGSALADTDDQATIWVNRLGASISISEVWCESDAGTPTIQLQKDDGTPTNMLSVNLSCSTTGATSTTFVSGENTLASGDRLDFQVVAAGGTAKRITVYAKY